MFDSLGPSEQACISEELGDDDLQSFLEQPVLWSRGVAGERALFPCLEPSEAGELLLAMMFAAIEEEGLTLGSEERACLRDQIGDIDWTTPVEPDSGDDSEALAGLSSGFATCVPDLLIAAMGIQPGDLSDGERACLVDSIADILSATLIASDLADDPTAAAGLTARMMSCVPDFFLEMMLAGFDIRLDELAGEERACLRDWLTGFDWAGAYGEDAAAFAGPTLGMMRCLPDIFLELMVSDVGVDLEEFTGDERACLRDWLLGIDATALAESAFGDDPAGFAAGMVGCAPDVFFVALLTEAGLDPDRLSDEQRTCLQEWMIGNDSTSLAGLLFSGFPEVPGEAVATCGIDDHANGYDAATPLGVGESLDGMLDYDLDVDYFVFEAEAGRSYEIDVALDTLEDSTVTLYDPDGRELPYNDDHADSLASRLVWEAPDPGRYYLAVAGYDSGSYTLTVTASATTDDATDDPAT